MVVLPPYPILAGPLSPIPEPPHSPYTDDQAPPAPPPSVELLDTPGLPPVGVSDAIRPPLTLDSYICLELTSIESRIATIRAMLAPK